MKKKFILTGMLVLVPVISVATVACTNSASSDFSSASNKTISLGNVTGTAGQVENLYKAAVQSLEAVSKKETDAKKTALETFTTEVKAVTSKLYAKTDTVAAGTIRALIVALKTDSATYEKDLKAVADALKTSVSDLEKAYIKVAKALDETQTDATAKADFAKLDLLQGLYSGYAAVKAPEHQWLDLARYFESQASSGAKTLEAKYDGNTAATKALDYAKTVAQYLNLATKRELQTVAMAQVVVTAKADSKVVEAVGKVKGSQADRLKLAVITADFETLIKGLEAKIGTVKTDLAAAKTAVTAVADTPSTTAFTEFEKLVNGLVANYEGSSDLTPAFRKDGLKKTTTDLKAALAALPSAAVDSVKTFNDLFQKASPTWSGAVGNTVNSLQSNNFLKEVDAKAKPTLDALTAKVESAAAAKTAVDKVVTSLKAMSDDYGKLAAFTPNADKVKETSAFILNQYIRSISSLVQIYLLQVAVDQSIGLTADDVAAGAVK